MHRGFFLSTIVHFFMKFWSSPLVLVSLLKWSPPSLSDATRGKDERQESAALGKAQLNEFICGLVTRT